MITILNGLTSFFHSETIPQISESYDCPQMLIRHDKELEQLKRMNQRKIEELTKKQAIEKRALPKRIRSEMKIREQMFRQSMRISSTSTLDPEAERDKLKKV